MKMNKKGFTLAELLIVIAIIAILIAIAIPVFAAQLENAKLQTDHANLRSAYAVVQTANLIGLTDAVAEIGGTYNTDGTFNKTGTPITIQSGKHAEKNDSCKTCVVDCHEWGKGDSIYIVEGAEEGTYELSNKASAGEGA